MSQRFEISHPALRELLQQQDGVIALRQLYGAGAKHHDVERMVRRRELRRAHRGIFVDHTGPLTPRQREWVAVLSAWPAALCDDSVLPGGGRGPVCIAIGPGRRVQVPAGVRVRRIVDLEERVRWHRSPPRIAIEHATLDRMSARLGEDDVAGAFAVLCWVLQSRETTAGRILDELNGRFRIGGRRVIEGMLTDVRDGICSVLERGYRDRVERAHGLPRAARQHVSVATGEPTHQDVRYRRYALVVELDGFAFHSSPEARNRDAARDLAELAATNSPTARVTYGLVFDNSCQTAMWIAAILRRRGWSGEFQRCPDCPS